MKACKIVILHGVNYWNAGDLAIMQALLHRIREEIPNSCFVVSSVFDLHASPRELDLKQCNAIETKYFLRYPFSRKTDVLLMFAAAVLSIPVAWLFGRLSLKCYGFLPRGIAETFRTLNDADIVISKGGNFLLDLGRGLPSYLLTLHQIYVAILLRKKVVLYAQSIGPFRRWISRYVVRGILKGARAILLREYESLASVSGVCGPLIEVTADESFLLPMAGKERAEEIKRELGIDDTSPLIGFSVLDWNGLYESGKEDRYDKKRYLLAISRAIDHAAEHYGATAVLIPHLVGFWSKGDDEVISTVLRNVRNIRKTRVAGPLMPSEIKALMSHIDLLVGTRMHANILALSMGVPTLAISYLPKTEGIMGMLGLRKWTIRIEDVEPARLVQLMDKLWNNKEEVRDSLKKAVQNVQARAHRNAQIVKDLLSEP